MVGDKNRKKLNQFENEKLAEIDEYIKTNSSLKCVKIMHDKLLSVAKFLRREEKGVLPFTFGVDVHKAMLKEEIEFMPKAYKLNLAKKYEIE